MAGRKPKPTALKKLEGNPGKRKLNTKEPIPAKGIRDIFGIVKPDGNRQFRTAFVEICKKVGKSELAAAVALYLLYADNEPCAGIFSGEFQLKANAVFYSSYYGRNKAVLSIY